MVVVVIENATTENYDSLKSFSFSIFILNKWLAHEYIQLLIKNFYLTYLHIHLFKYICKLNQYLIETNKFTVY